MFARQGRNLPDERMLGQFGKKNIRLNFELHNLITEILHLNFCLCEGAKLKWFVTRKLGAPS